MNGEEIALVRLPVAGLMSEQPAAEVAESVEGIAEAMRRCGCTLNNAFMQHTLLALPVIPELRISDLGLVDAKQFMLTEFFAEA